MASTSRSDRHCMFPAGFWEIPATGDKYDVWSGERLPLDNGFFKTILSESGGISDFRTSFPDRFGVSEMDLGGDAPSPRFSRVGGEAWGGFTSSSEWGFDGYRDEWEIIQENSGSKTGEASVKVGRYSVEERKDRILRYMQKRNQRNFNKTIKYACRKTLADRRKRVRGRFASNNDISQGEEECHEDRPKLNEDNEENWYQQTMWFYPSFLVE